MILPSRNIECLICFVYLFHRSKVCDKKLAFQLHPCGFCGNPFKRYKYEVFTDMIS